MDDFKQHFSPNQPIDYIYNPVNIDGILSDASDESERDLIDSLGPYIIHVGTFKKAKNHSLLIKAYKQSGITEKLVLLGRKGETYDDN